jgi:hypothetical protein
VRKTTKTSSASSDCEQKMFSLGRAVGFVYRRKKEGALCDVKTLMMLTLKTAQKMS